MDKVADNIYFFNIATKEGPYTFQENPQYIELTKNNFVRPRVRTKLPVGWNSAKVSCLVTPKLELANPMFQAAWWKSFNKREYILSKLYKPNYPLGESDVQSVRRRETHERRRRP